MFDPVWWTTVAVTSRLRVIAFNTIKNKAFVHLCAKESFRLIFTCTTHLLKVTCFCFFSPSSYKADMWLVPGQLWHCLEMKWQKLSWKSPLFFGFGVEQVVNTVTYCCVIISWNALWYHISNCESRFTSRGLRTLKKRPVDYQNTAMHIIPVGIHL